LTSVKCKIIFFYRFPKEKTKREMWASQLKEEDFEPGPFTTICSDHFEEDCFIETKFRRELKPNAIPTKFKAETDQKKRKRSQDAFLDHEETMKKKLPRTQLHTS
jgi:THAP domain